MRTVLFPHPLSLPVSTQALQTIHHGSAVSVHNSTHSFSETPGEHRGLQIHFVLGSLVLPLLTLQAPHPASHHLWMILTRVRIDLEEGHDKRYGRGARGPTLLEWGPQDPHREQDFSVVGCFVTFMLLLSI